VRRVVWGLIRRLANAINMEIKYTRYMHAAASITTAGPCWRTGNKLIPPTDSRLGKELMPGDVAPNDSRYCMEEATLSIETQKTSKK
jgi:hypothetical protein